MCFYHVDAETKKKRLSYSQIDIFALFGDDTSNLATVQICAAEFRREKETLQTDQMYERFVTADTEENIDLFIFFTM